MKLSRIVREPISLSAAKKAPPENTALARTLAIPSLACCPASLKLCAAEKCDMRMRIMMAAH